MSFKLSEKLNLSPKTKRIINIVVDVVVAVVLAFALFLAICTISSKRKGYKQYTEFFGTAYLAVESTSMQPTFDMGDLIKIKTVSAIEAENLKEGDIITFKTIIREDDKIVLNTHRIVEVIKDSEDNVVSFRTQGDNKETNSTPDARLVKISDVVGVYKGKASGIGNVFLFMTTSAGFFVCVVLPTLLIVVYCAVNLVLVIRKEKKKQTVEAMQAQYDERERIRQELLAEMRANSAAEAQPAAPTTETAAPPQNEEPVEEKDVSSEDNKADEDNNTEKD